VNPCVNSTTCNTALGRCNVTFVSCDDGDPCTLDECNPFTGECSHTPIAGCCTQDTQCVSGDPCVGRYCDQATNKCVFVDYSCNDYDACTLDYCDAETGLCQHEGLGLECLDQCELDADCWRNNGGGNYCSLPTCVYDPVAGHNKCQGQDILCNDGNSCTNDRCRPSLGCVFLPNRTCNAECLTNADCFDNDLCTTDTCNPMTGRCQNVLQVCNDGDPCTQDSCNPTTGQCIYRECAGCSCSVCDIQDPTGGQNGCQRTDTCGIGVCESFPWSGPVCTFVPSQCNDGDPCTLDSCTAEGTCSNVAIPKCVGCWNDQQCKDNNQCTVDYCDTETRTCVHVYVCG